MKIYIHFFIGKNILGEKDTTLKNCPAIIVANHNSHMDTAVILSMFSCKEIVNVYILAASDYFFRNKIFSWVSRNILGLIPLDRSKVSTNIFSELYGVLDKGGIILMYPEGSRGISGKMGNIKKGIAKISENYKHVPILPIKLSRTENVLPKGRYIPLPFIINLEIKKTILYITNEEVLENIKQALL